MFSNDLPILEKKREKLLENSYYLNNEYIFCESNN